nr:reverse transcriptase domain-containing protein [Tanacetum cinerariifolium]
EDLVSKVINEFFPPSRTTSLRNEISNFEQKFGESFHEAWERYKDLIRACPHHSFTELHQLNTFYNALNPTDQDSLNAVAGGNLLERSTQDVLTIIENKSKVKAVKETCVTCGGAHPYYQCLAAGGNTFPEYRDNIQEYASAATTNYNQGNHDYRPQGVANQMRPPENVPKAAKDTMIPTNNENTEDVQPQEVSSKPPVSTSEPTNTPVSASKPNPQASIPYPS